MSVFSVYSSLFPVFLEYSALYSQGILSSKIGHFYAMSQSETSHVFQHYLVSYIHTNISLDALRAEVCIVRQTQRSISAVATGYCTGAYREEACDDARARPHP